MNWADIGSKILSVLLWVKSNYQILLLVLMLLLLPAVGWFSFTKGDTSGYQRAKLEDLAVRPDTAVKMAPAVVPAPITKQIKGTRTPLTVDYQTRIDSAVLAAKDSMERAYRQSLAPWSYDSYDTTLVVVNDRKVRVPSLAHIDVSTIDHIAQVIVALLPFEVPMDVITRELPVSTGPTDTEKMEYRIEGAGILTGVALIIYLIIHFL